MPCMVVKGSMGSTAVSSGSPAGRMTRRISSSYFCGEFVIALVVGGHAHDGAGAVVHQDVVRHPDRHLLAVVRIDGIAAGVDAMLLDLADVAHFPGLALLGDEVVRLRRAAGRCFWSRRATRGCWGASCNEVAPKMVSTRVVKTVMVALVGSVAPSSLKSTSVPSLRPIQLRCMVRTFSGQPGRRSRSRSNSSA